MIRRFTLINEYGQTYALDDVRTGFLMNPSGLGYNIKGKYTLFGSEWLKSDDTIDQTTISGTVVFGSDSPYQRAHEFVEFVMTSKSITLSYQTDVGTYYKDVDINRYKKSEIGSSGFLECEIEMTPKTLWYLPSNQVIKLEPVIGTGLRFTFTLPNIWMNYTNGTVTILNDGHVPAPFKASIEGAISNPSIILLQNGSEVARLDVTEEIAAGSTLEYSSKDGDVYLYVDNHNGTQTDLATALDITNSNIFKIPVGTYQLRLEADSQITSCTFVIYKQYIAV